MRCAVTPEMVTELQSDDVFVFGSNAQGNHAAGAAKKALEWGAVMGEGFGLHGQTYAIDTMSGLDRIREQVEKFKGFIEWYPDRHFLITSLGCGIAGHTPEEVSPFFNGFLELPNVSLPQSFIDVLTKDNNND